MIRLVEEVMKIELNKEIITVQIIRKPNKNMYMRFLNSQTLEVSCNPWLSEKKIQSLLKQNEKSLAKMHEKKREEEEKNQYFWYLGKKYIPLFDLNEKSVTFYGEYIKAKDEKMLEKFYQKECIRVFESEVRRILPFFANIPKFQVKIRFMKTRWGVNNRGNNTITLNSELLKKDLDLLDYVIIHELCHFYEANHSERFWDHVKEYYPKYKEARKRLRS